MYSPRVVAASREALEQRLRLPLRDYSETEILDFAYQMRDLDWEEPQATILSLPEETQKYIFNELQRSKIDFLYWCTRYARITDDKGRVSTLKPWPSQMALLNKLALIEEKEWSYFENSPNLRELECKMMLTLLKSRQVGGTVIAEALLNHLTIFSLNTRTIIASDHPDTSLNLFRVFTGILDNLPGWMRPAMDARVKATNLHFPALNSDVIVGAGNQKTSLGQGMTVDAVHLTEVSTWDPANALSIDHDLRPAFASSRKHHSLMILESTGAGGRGNWFHDQFQAAASGRSLFHHLFIGWFMCPDKFAMRAEGIEFTDITKGVARRVKSETGVELSREQMAWYQTHRQDYEAKGELEVFLQEHPSTAEEAFQTGLRSVFGLELRSEMRGKLRDPIAVYDVNMVSQKLREVNLEAWLRSDDPEKADGRLLIWELARPGCLYVVGVDASYGIDGGDSSAIEVLRVGNRFLPDEQVAEWRGNISPSDLHVPAWLVGHIYTDKTAGLPAKMAVESNPGSPGIVCQTDLMRRGYPHFYIYKKPLRQYGGFSKEVGWWTTPGTRMAMLEGGVDSIKKRELAINSTGFLEEMSTFISMTTQTGRRSYEHAPEYHDDRIVALFIALYVAHENDMTNLADERRKEWERKALPSQPVREFQSLGCSYDEAIQKWEASLEA